MTLTQHASPRRAPLSFHVDLPLGERASSLARRTVAGILRSWQVLDEDWNYDVQLLCSELVSNAVRHGGLRIALGLTLDDSTLTVEVRDGSPLAPERPAEPDDESGRGLAIIEVLADAWGVTPHDDGKTVWATMTLPQVPEQRQAPRAGAPTDRQRAAT